MMGGKNWPETSKVNSDQLKNRNKTNRRVQDVGFDLIIPGGIGFFSIKSRLTCPPGVGVPGAAGSRPST